MADILRSQYRDYSRTYLSWDAASWHISKKLLAHVEQINAQAEKDCSPRIELAPLPACAQFLNVIESIFSGMSRAIIHNSDYPSLDAAKAAIDRYFAERNTHFAENPKRAGFKIWGKERVPSEFHEGQNCKAPGVSLGAGTIPVGAARIIRYSRCELVWPRVERPLQTTCPVDDVRAAATRVMILGGWYSRVKEGDRPLSNIELSRRRPGAICVIAFGRATAMRLQIITDEGRDSMRLSALPPPDCKRSIQSP